ncbi:MAG: hypothetical protein GX773_04815, partial [Chloroflexi bacterium]|nr:hypothetical protein [Chloroflexota bacterium]
MTKTLMLLRHAKSSWKDQSLKDFDRPLKKKGKKAAKLIAKMMAHNQILPDAVLSSPAKRARETTEIVNKHSGFEGSTQFLDSLYMAEPMDYIIALRELPDEVDRVLVVGHNPGLEALMNLVDGKSDALPTATLAVLNLQLNHWRDFDTSTAGELRNFWDPDEMDLEEIEDIDYTSDRKIDKKTLQTLST